jgi:regulator of RNase E activity RraB
MMFDSRHPDDVFMQQLELLGLDLNRPQAVEHFLYFAKQDGAELAAQKLRAEGYTAEVSARPSDSNWLVLARGRMVPAAEKISKICNQMDELAATCGGHYDGWGTPFTK